MWSHSCRPTNHRVTLSPCKNRAILSASQIYVCCLKGSVRSMLWICRKASYVKIMISTFYNEACSPQVALGCLNVTLRESWMCKILVPAQNFLMRSCTSNTRDWAPDGNAASVPLGNHRLTYQVHWVCGTVYVLAYSEGKKRHWLASCVCFPDAVIEKWIVLVKALSDCCPYRDTAKGREKIYSPLCPLYFRNGRGAGDVGEEVKLGAAHTQFIKDANDIKLINSFGGVL